MAGKSESPRKGDVGANESSLSIRGVSIPRPTPVNDSRVRRMPGKRTGLGLYEFVTSLFVANEDLASTAPAFPSGKPLTNAEIEEAIKEEFSVFPEFVAKVGHKDWKAGVFRSKYNRGALAMVGGKFVRPKMMSFRYDADGDPVETRWGSRKLSPRDQFGLAKYFKIEDPRIPTWLDSEDRQTNVRRSLKTSNVPGTATVVRDGIKPEVKANGHRTYLPSKRELDAIARSENKRPRRGRHSGSRSRKSAGRGLR
jgi:hypothetical protein